MNILKLQQKYGTRTRDKYDRDNATISLLNEIYSCFDSEEDKKKEGLEKIVLLKNFLIDSEFFLDF